MSISTNIEIGKAWAGNVQVGEAYVGDRLIYKAQSDPITLRCTVKQDADIKRWGHIDYEITEDWDIMTIIDSSWGKSYGGFETSIQLIDGGTIETLVNRSGGYGGYPMPEEPIIESGTQYSVKKGQTIRLVVGASYNPNLSGSFETTSWVSFVLT